MRILIIENEQNAIERLEKLLGMVAPEKTIAGICHSIHETKQWLNENEQPDLILSDVHLPDGLSFEIFEQLDKKIHVIFISAYDTYAIQAFKNRGLHYILKPVNKEDLKEAIERHDHVNTPNAPARDQSAAVKYQERFIIKTGAQIKLIYDKEIAYLFTENKAVFIVNFSNQKFLMPASIESFEKSLNPKMFYRINRQVIVNINAIRKMAPASKQRIQLTLEPSSTHETITSFERTPNFKKWLMGEI